MTDPWQTLAGPVLSASYAYGVRRYVVGPTIELHLPLHLSFEVDALYRRTGFDGFGTFPITATQNEFVETRTAINDWEIPFLGKYTMTLGPIHPFVDSGVTLRHISVAYGRAVTTNLTTNVTTTGPANTPLRSNSTGFTVGGGLSLKAGHLRIEPEVRYTHWGSDTIQTGYGHVNIQSVENQADLLVGLTF